MSLSKESPNFSVFLHCTCVYGQPSLYFKDTKEIEMLLLWHIK